MIRRTGATAAAVAALLLLAPPTDAQTHRTALGLTGGWSFHGDLTPGLSSETRLEQGWLAGGQVEQWTSTGRFGFRVNGGFGQRSLQDAPGSEFQMYMADVDFLVRPLRAGRDRWVSPYVALGAGGVRYAAAGGGSPIAGGAYGPDPVTRVHIVGGLGIDLLPSGRYGLRLEASDQVILASVGESPPTNGTPMVHNPRVQAAFQLRFGEVDSPRLLARSVPAPPRESARSGRAESADPEAVERLERELEQREQESARELNRLAERVAELEREAREREVRERVESDSTPTAEAPVAAETRARPAAQPQVAEARLFTVLVNAFFEARTARVWSERLGQRDLPVWVDDARIQGQHVMRVRVGALPTQAEAERLGRTLEQDYGWSFSVVELDEGAELPPNAVRATTSFLSGR